MVDVEFIDSIVKDVFKEFPSKIEGYQSRKTEPRIANELLMQKLPEILIVND